MSLTINRANTLMYSQRPEASQAKINNNETKQLGDQVNLSGSRVSNEPKVPKKWTFLHFTAADNNLKNFMTNDVNEMERVGSTDKLNVISLFDRGGSDCKLYYLEQDDDNGTINSPILKDYGNTNMAEPKTLTNFLIEMTNQYPSEHLAVILADHGSGWEGAIKDETSKSGPMPMPTIRKALEDFEKQTGKTIDVLGFDSCLMATGEVADEMKGVAHYMVASQETEGGEGWPYTPLLTSGPKTKDGHTDSILAQMARALDERLDITPEELAKKMVTNCEHNDPASIPTLSAVDLSKMDKYEEATGAFANAIIDTDTPNSVFRDIAQKTQKFYYKKLKDQYHFAELVSKSPDIMDEKLKEAAKGLMKTIGEEVVIQNQHRKRRYANAHGLSAEIPNSPDGTPANYNDLQYTKNTKWSEAVNKFMKN